MNDLKLSIIFGVFARVITFFNQLFSVPLTIALIGLEGFTRYNIMTAGVAWLITLGGCLLPSIVGDISRASSDNNYLLISKKISSSLALMLTFCMLVAIIYTICFNKLSVESHAILLFSLIIIFASTSESIRQGLGENYKNSIYNGIANLFALGSISLLYFYKIETNLFVILVVTLGSIALLKVINLAQLMSFFELKNIDIDSCKDMLIKALGFILISIAYYFNTAGMVTVLGLCNYQDVTQFIVLQKIVLIIMGVVVMIRNPLWGIIAKLRYQGGSQSILAGYEKYLKLYILCTPFLLLFLYYGIEPFLKLWAKGVIVDKNTIISFSIYITIILFSYINSILYYGLEIFNKISKLLILEAAINIIGVFILSKNNAPLSSIFILLTVISIVINLNVYLLIRRVCNSDN